MNNRFTLAVLPRTERGASLVLSASPDNTKLVYCHGHSVIMRDLDSPQYADVYTQHAHDVNVAKYSPSGFYIASADKSGLVRIWDTVNKEHILKNEFRPLSGPIKDLAWSPDNQRMVVVGEGRDKFGHVFLADTGTSNGDITGQSRPVNSCDFRPARPFRIITGSEDNTAAVYEGPPFKFKCTKTEHSRYVQTVRYSLDGKLWASGGFDGKLFVYDGTDSNLVKEIMDSAVSSGDGGKAHEGGIYGLSWSPDHRQILTASGDKTCKVWDVETGSKVHQFDLGDSIEAMQLGCVWAGPHLVSAALSGTLSFLDPRSGSGPVRVVEGHNKPIVALTAGDDAKTVYTGGSDGRVVHWDTENGVATVKDNGGLACQINGLKWSKNSGLSAVAIDASLRKFADGSCLKFKSEPKGLDEADDGITVVATLSSVAVVNRSGAISSELPVSYEPACVAVRDDRVAVGEGGQGQSVHVYAFNPSSGLGEEVATFKATGAVTAMAFSPDGGYLAVADANRKVHLLKANDGSFEKAHTREWGFHTAKVTCVAFSPNGKMVASGGLDCAVILWSVEQPAKHFIVQSAHTQSPITGVSWLDNATLVSAGHDANLKIWNVTWNIAN